MQQKKYSTIPVEKQTVTTLDKKEKGNLLDEMLNSDGLIESQLDVEVVDEILSTSIYNRPEVAIREVFKQRTSTMQNSPKARSKTTNQHYF